MMSDPDMALVVLWRLLGSFSVNEGDCLESKQYVIKPYGTYKDIAPKVTKVHGITTEYASKHGVDVVWFSE